MRIQDDNSVGIVPVHIKQDGTILFCVVHHTAGHWAFPKGHQDAGESREAAARRELYEETGIATCKIDTICTFTEHYSFQKDNTRYDKEVIYVIGFVDSTDHMAPDAFRGEITESQWLPYYDAKETLTFPESKKVLDDVLEYFNKKN